MGRIGLALDVGPLLASGIASLQEGIDSRCAVVFKITGEFCDEISNGNAMV